MSDINSIDSAMEDGIDDIFTLTIRLQIADIKRFHKVENDASYCPSVDSVDYNKKKLLVFYGYLTADFYAQGSIKMLSPARFVSEQNLAQKKKVSARFALPGI